MKPQLCFQLGGVLFSLAFHGVVCGLLLDERGPERLRAPPIEVSLMPAPEPAPELVTAAPAEEVAPKPPPEPKPRPPKPRAKNTKARTVTRDATQAEPPRPAPAEEVASTEPETLAFDGLTLTNAQGSWASPVGSGNPRVGPVGAPRTSTASASPQEGEGSGDGQPGLPWASADDLSHAPMPPALDARLAELYPEQARRIGKEGEALMKVRILPDGSVGSLRKLAATDDSFAGACRRLLRSSHWSRPIDHKGRAVATDVHYRCRFVLN